MSDDSGVDAGDIKPRSARTIRIPEGITYELLLGFDSKLSGLAAKFEALLQTIGNHASSDRDHEARIRSLESRLTTLDASSTTNRGNWQLVWNTSLSALAFLAAAVGDLIIAFHHS